MVRTKQKIAGILGGALLLLAACGRAPEGWTPVLEETSTGFLAAEVGEALEHLEEARAALPKDPEEAAAALDEAEAALRRLTDYYLPLLEARESAYNAYRLHARGESEMAGRELDRIEEILVAVAEGKGELMVHELEEPLEMASDARLAVAGGSREARPLLEALAQRLNAMLVKGGLIAR